MVMTAITTETTDTKNEPNYKKVNANGEQQIRTAFTSMLAEKNSRFAKLIDYFIGGLARSVGPN